ncbi:MAG TPA: ParB N-terminal domain-containing protein [Thermoanaerobaculia bacterium]|nr:ParB N-terminal domain-containing protein [Thermoanaerobaculia bacterium]
MPPRRKKAKEASRGLAAEEVASGSPPNAAGQLRESIEKDGGSVLAVFRDPLGSHWQVLAALPLRIVEPTPFQRDLSDAHVKRLTNVIDTLGRFLDPIIAVRTDDGVYWTPNGHHRLSAMRRLGAKSIVALVLPEKEIAYKILALNTEKAHNLREKSLEVIRMARDLAEHESSMRGGPGGPPGPLAEKDYALDFDEPALLTLGICYEKNGRFPGGAYHPVLKRVDEFFEEKLPRALQKREKRAGTVMALEEAVSKAIKALQEKGFQSPYLRAFVVARINPLRFQKKGSAKADFDATLDKMLASAKKFNAESVKADQLARTGGAPEES